MLNYRFLSGIAAAWLAIAPVAALRAETARALFDAWLAAFNSGDEVAIKAFYGTHLGDPEAAYPRDQRAETCGFDLARIENSSATAFSALVVERCFPAMRRISFTVADDGAALKDFRMRSFALSQEGALAATRDIATRLAKRNEFAGSVIIARDGEDPWAFNAGTMSNENATMIGANTKMFLASAGKMFTAIAILQLVERGKVHLDAPLSRYVKNYPNRKMAMATVRQLLNHRGGTGEDGVLRREEGANRARVRTIEDYIALNGRRSPDFPPGSKADYSNYGYILLGAIIERVSGGSYQDYVTRHVFAPAGMRDTGYPDLDHLSDVATGYTTFFGAERKEVSIRSTLPWRGSAAGGGVSTANDMLRFFQALAAGKLLSPPMLRVATAAGDTPWYGMGFIVTPSPHGMWGHGGFSYGMSTGFQRLASDRTTVICLAARDMACDRIVNAWYWRAFGLIE